MTRGRLTSKCRALALTLDLYQRHDGEFEKVSQMNDAHLVNALLKALLDGEQKSLTSPLAAEVKRRGIENYAMSVCAERQAELDRIAAVDRRMGWTKSKRRAASGATRSSSTRATSRTARKRARSGRNSTAKRTKNER